MVGGNKPGKGLLTKAGVGAEGEEGGGVMKRGSGSG